LGLDEATAAKVETASLEELKEYTSKEEMKNYIPKTRFDEVNTEKNKLTETLKERDAQLETLKNSKGDVDALKTQITELQTANTAKDNEHAAEIKTLKVNAAVDAALAAAKAKNIKAVRALLDLDSKSRNQDYKCISPCS